MRRILLDVFILFVIVATVLFVYRTYGDMIISHIFGNVPGTMYLESTPISVMIADEPEEHRVGLSGRESLGEFEGMLFIFPEENFYNMWMKDMLFPIDIIWIDNSYTVVHIKKNATPESYPDTFVSPVPARFVLEVNAFVTENENIAVGDKVTLPPRAVPWDLIELVE